MDENIKLIQDFLNQAGNKDDIIALCSEYFPDVTSLIKPDTSQSLIVENLLDYVQKYNLIVNLLAAIQKTWPDQYALKLEKFVIASDISAKSNPKEYDPEFIFISHAHKDTEFAHQLSNDLKIRGWQTWIAPESINPGEKWVEAIDRGLTTSGIFLLVLTPAALLSPWVKNETNIAIKLEMEGKIRFYPIEVEACQIPNLWDSYQRVSFIDSYESGLNQLLQEIRERKEGLSILSSKLKLSEQIKTGSKNTINIKPHDSILERVQKMLTDKNVVSGIIGVAILAVFTIFLRLAFPGLTGDYLALFAATMALVFILLLREYHARSGRNKRKILIIGIAIFATLVISAILVYLFNIIEISNPAY